ncbi:hypothetical protein PIB30_087135 [Stylosanthes scabra]|uniref:Uncharacterized protein n=1 Tax=Stylosanthes scabra TaxID=79078 RepID=A0ABU6YU45_9FABA|nr:hypothetical protein [Stylosanthes scabra]
MECFITWQPERENSGLFDWKSIINSLLNKTNEPKKKNGERKLEEQERKNLKHSIRVPMPRRGDSRLGVQSSSPGSNHPRLGDGLLRAKPPTPRRGHLRLGVAHQSQASPGHSKPTPRRPTQRLGVAKHSEAQV